MQIHLKPREHKLLAVFDLALALVVDKRLVADLAELVLEPRAHHVVPQLVGAFFALIQILARAQLHQHAQGVLHRRVVDCGRVRAHERGAYIRVAAADFQAQLLGVDALVHVHDQRQGRSWLCHVQTPHSSCGGRPRAAPLTGATPAHPPVPLR